MAITDPSVWRPPINAVSFRGARVKQQTNHPALLTARVCFVSGLMVCEEELYAGRWVNRYWTSTGQIKPKVHLQGQSETRAGLPIDVFQLGIEGPNLAGSWKWIGDRL